MTGDVVVTQKTFAEVASRIKIIVDWTSDGSGDVVSDPIDAIGFIVEVETVPGTGSVKPSDDYDVTITDPYGYNLMDEKTIDNRDYVNAERVIAATPRWVDDYMTVTVAHAGASTQGKIIIWIDRTTP